MLEELKFNRGFKEGSNLLAELTDNNVLSGKRNIQHSKW